MKKLLKFTFNIIILITLIGIVPNKSSAETGISFYGGLSTPSDKIARIYNKDKIYSNSLKQNIELLTAGAKEGYHLGLRASMPISGNLLFHAGVAWHRFPQSEVAIKNEAQQEVARIQICQDLFPVSAGMHYYLINSFIGVYGLGELTYNYAKSTVNYSYNGIGVPLNLDDINTQNSLSRVGGGLGAGITFDVFLAKLSLEAKYNVMNLIAKDEGEPAKSFFSLSLGINFGGSPAK